MIQSTETTIDEISHHYDELDDFYRELWGVHLHHGLWESPFDSKEEAVINLSRKVLSHLGDISRKHLIDIGCGYGETSKLALLQGAGSVTGITLSQKQFHFARLHSDQLALNYVLGDWLKNNFADNTFDGAFSIECFSHIKDKKHFFEEIKRTLRPGGKFVMTAWLCDEDPSTFDKKLILGPICKEGRLPSLLSEKEVLVYIEESGLTFKEHIDLGSKVWRTWLISSRQLMKLLNIRGVRYFLNNKNSERRFVLSVLRILAGYRKGCFKYGLFIMEN